MTEQSQSMQDAMTDMVKASEQFNGLMQQVSSKSTSEDDPSASVMTDFSEAFQELSSKIMDNPSALLEGQVSLMKDHLNLWQQTALKFAGLDSEVGD